MMGALDRWQETLQRGLECPWPRVDGFAVAAQRAREVERCEKMRKVSGNGGEPIAAGLA